MTIDTPRAEELSAEVKAPGGRRSSLFQVVGGSPAHKRLKMVLIAIGVLVAAVIPLGSPSVTNDTLTRVMIYAIAALGLNLLVGYTGQISLGHGAFFAIGAYTTAALMTKWDWNFFLTIPAAALVCGVLGLLIGIPILRLRGLYLALMTLALTIAVIPIIKKAKPLTGGTEGIGIDQPQPKFGLAVDQYYYLIALALTLIAMAVAVNLTRGNLGRALLSIRDYDRAATTAGVNKARVKAQVFAYSTAFAGAAGSLYTMVNGYIAPESFALFLSLTLLASIVIGGLGTITGALLGGLFLEYSQQWAQNIDQNATGVIYGAALILVIYLMPGGAARLIRWLAGFVVGIKEPPPQQRTSAAVEAGEQNVTDPVPASPGATRTSK